MAEIIALKYVKPGAFRPSIPARDLDAAELRVTAAAQKRTVDDLVAEAIGSGLYEPVFDIPPAPEPVPDPYEGLTKAELVAHAAERGVEVDPKATNAAIRDTLVAAAAPAPEPEADAKP